MKRLYENGIFQENEFIEVYKETIKKIFISIIGKKSDIDKKYLISEKALLKATAEISNKLNNKTLESDYLFASIVFIELCRRHIVHITEENLLDNDIFLDINCWGAIILIFKNIFNVNFKYSQKDFISNLVNDIVIKGINEKSLEKILKEKIMNL